MVGGLRLPVLLRGDDDPFPDPRRFDSEGLIAMGGALSTERLLTAYRMGIFPWYGEGLVPLWWSPDPRALFNLARLHVSHSLQRTIARGEFMLTFDRCFRRVMTHCGENRPEGTWVIPEMLDAYELLHQKGHAHSLEVWCDDDLVGGIYGVRIGRLFCAESMFHRRTDMSKVALVAMVRSLFAAGIETFEVQFVTPHLASFGAFAIPRAEYLRRARLHAGKPLELGDPLLLQAWRG
jgi:leucyl/phenylalanyl-tRNA--protein transferase